MEKNFCRGCGKRISGSPKFMNLINKEKIYEFEEGMYCEKCAKVKVDRRRREM